jgi:signal transduction histidine kinase
VTSPTSRVSLVRYLMTRILLCVVPIVGVGVGVHWWFQERLLEQQFDAGLVERATTLATLITRDGEALRFEFADEFMPQYAREERPYFFQIRHPDGRSFERSYSLRGEDLPFLHGPLDAPAHFETVLQRGVRVRCVGIEFPERLDARPDAAHPASVVVVLGADALELHDVLRRGYREVAITGFVSLAAIAAFVTLTLRRGARLLGSVVREVERIEPGSLGRPIELERVPEEIRPIVGALNGSLESIHGYVERERRFTADVAHELRTPITELRVAAELALKWPDDASTARLARDAHAIALQMGALVESLLELATLESDDHRGREEPFDLVALVEQTIDSALRTERDTAARRGGGREVALDAPQRLMLVGEPRLWEVVVRNLLDNALCYSSPGAPIAVSLRADGDGARLCVSNPTVSLDQEGARRCTERLWRGTARVGSDLHFGLGLSIVQAACARLRQELDVRLEQDVFHATIARGQARPASSSRDRARAGHDLDPQRSSTST